MLLAPYLSFAAEPDKAATLNRSLVLRTESASFFLFSPEALSHRRNSPMGWEGYDFAAGPELAAGNMVAFCTGGDGAYRFRITNGGLTAREQQRSNGAWNFRLKVRHGRVLLDNGDHLPNEATVDQNEDNLKKDLKEDLIALGEQWISLPNGDYQVTIHVVSRTAGNAARPSGAEQRQAELPGYVICFRAVNRLESVRGSRMPPMLDLAPGAQPREMKSVTEYRRYEEDFAFAVPKQAPVLIASQGPIVPGFNARLPVTDEFHEAVEGRAPPREANSTVRIEQVVLIDSVRTPTLGVLAAPAGGSRGNNEPWTINFTPKRLVTVTKLRRGKLGLEGEIAPLARPMNASARQIEALKSAFAVYALKNQAYRSEIEYPDFEAERVAATKSASGLLNLLIHHVQMSADARRRLLALSDAERARELQTLLQVGQ